MIYKLLILGGLLGFSVDGFSAEVKKINEKRGIVFVNSGKVDGFSRSKRVCFYLKSGVMAGCGKIRKATMKTSRVKVPTSVLSKIAVGQIAKLKGIRPPASMAKPFMTLSTNYVMSPITPFSYNKLAYRPATNQDAGLKVDEESKGSYIGGGIAADFEGAKVRTGFKYRSHRNYEAQSQLEGDSSDLVDATTSATSFGGFVEYTLWKTAPYHSRRFHLSSGLDFDHSVVSILTEKSEDTAAAALTDASSTLDVVSLRLSPGVHFVFNDWGIYFDTALLLPLTSQKSLSAKVADSSGLSLIDADPETRENIRNSLGHDAGSIGVETTLGLGIMF